MTIRYNCNNCGEIGHTPEMGEAPAISVRGVLIVDTHFRATRHEDITAQGEKSAVRIHFYDSNDGKGNISRGASVYVAANK